MMLFVAVVGMIIASLGIVGGLTSRCEKIPKKYAAEMLIGFGIMGVSFFLL